MKEKPKKEICVACNTPQYIHFAGACFECNTGINPKKIKR